MNILKKVEKVFFGYMRTTIAQQNLKQKAKKEE